MERWNQEIHLTYDATSIDRGATRSPSSTSPSSSLFPGPSNFTSTFKDPLAAIGISEGSGFAIAKRWTSGPAPGEQATLEIRVGGNADDALDASALDHDAARQAQRFLELIHFRYIPNHEHPSQVLVSQRAALQEALITSLRRRRTRDAAGAVAGARFDEALNAVADAAGALVGPINEILGRTGGPVELLELATPEDWAEVVWALAFKLKAEGLEPLDSRVHGSGSQSQVMYQMLHFLDTRFGSSFGWHQATVWAVEEPESFLHSDLKNELTAFFTDSANSERFQVFVTTHDLVFAAAAEQRQWITLDGGDSTAQSLTASNLADRSISEGVSPFVHPLNLTAMKPTLLLEGPSDVWYVNEAYRHAVRTSPWEVRYLKDVDPAATGGKDALKQYLKGNQAALRARPTQSPVVAILDWEVKDGEAESVRTLIEAHPRSTASRWRADDANPDLAESWVGIERYLATELVEAVASAHPDAGMTRQAGGSTLWELAPQKKDKAKKLLIAACAERDQPADLQRIIDLLPWLESFLGPPASQAPLPGL